MNYQFSQQIPWRMPGSSVMKNIITESWMKLSKINLFSFHLFLGWMLYIIPSISTYIGLGLIVAGYYYIISDPKYHAMVPIYFSAYIVGFEVLLRMTGSRLFWEFGKYAVIYFLLLGIIKNRGKLFIILLNIQSLSQRKIFMGNR